MTSLDKLLPEYATQHAFPDTAIHGPVVLAWDEPAKRFVPTSPAAVRADPKRYRFWSEDRRVNKREMK